MSFGQKIRPLDAIKAILSDYPLGTSLFREFVQNSDDAGASEQIFVLDRRTHRHPGLRVIQCQGPAFIAYNDAEFEEDDWVALQTISQSSKRLDSKKIGKYGKGFRSCFHISDTPQVISGDTWVIFDPHERVFRDGGRRQNLGEDDETKGLLTSLDFLRDPESNPNELLGSAIRLPLRSVDINELRATTPDIIKQLLLDFVKEELRDVLLFVRNIRKIEILEIDEDGIMEEVASASLRVLKEEVRGMDRFMTVLVSMKAPSLPLPEIEAERVWYKVHCSVSLDYCCDLLSKRLPEYEGVKDDVERQKLSPEVGIAIPADKDGTRGRLFTFLPLPIFTGFPCHIQGVFALTSDRQHLRNRDEVLQSTSVDRLFVEWNSIVFDVIAPLAWSKMINYLVTDGLLGKYGVFDIWPPRQNDDAKGNASYWIHILREVTRQTISFGYAVWPVARGTKEQSQRYEVLTQSSTTLVKAVQNSSDGLEMLGCSFAFAALERAGITVLVIPEDVVGILGLLENFECREICPESTRMALLERQHVLWDASSEDRHEILRYLLSSERLGNILDLPLLPMLNGEHHTLKRLGRSSAGSANCRVLLSSKARNLFGRYDPSAIAIDDLPKTDVFHNQSLDGFNLCRLVERVDIVYGYLEIVLREQGIRISETCLTWICDFWDWMAECLSPSKRQQLLDRMMGLELVPLSELTTLPLDKDKPVFFLKEKDDVPEDVLIASGVPILHQQCSRSMRKLLQQAQYAKHILQLNQLLLAIDVRATGLLATDQLHVLRDFVVRVVRGVSEVTIAARNRLKELPVFPLLGPFGSDARYDGVPAGKIFLIKIDEGRQSAPLPAIEDVCYVEATPSGQLLSQTLDPNLEVMGYEDIPRLATENFETQSREYQMVLIEYLVEQQDSLPRSLLRILRRTPFVAVGKESEDVYAAPEEVVSLEGELAVLFQPGNRRYPKMKDTISKRIVEGLERLDLLMKTLTFEVACECIRSLHEMPSGGGKKPKVYSLARSLLKLIDDAELDLSQSEIAFSLRWIPAEDGKIFKVDECSDSRNRDLCDLVMPICSLKIRTPTLLSLFGWNTPLSIGMLLDQMKETIHLRKKSKTRYSARVFAILEELGKRIGELSSDDVKAFGEITTGGWLPVGSEYIEGQYVLLSSYDAPYPFRQVTVSDNQREILRRIGCSESPTPAAIINALKGAVESKKRFSHIVDLLTLLPSVCSAPDLYRLKIPILADDNKLYDIDKIHFKDIGASGEDLSLGSFILTHPKITAELAKSLNLRLLSECPEFSSLRQCDDEEMHEDITDRISGALRQYKRDQFFLEFLANAVDAGATEMSIIVDEALQLSTTSPLFLENSTFHSQPALIVHNDSVFKESDFQGIRRIGKGSKRSEDEKIGRFGLGALSAYHFSEITVIVSGGFILFMDPSRKHFVSSMRNSRFFPISVVRRLFPEQLARIEGLKGFSRDLDVYKGTLFILPLRSEEQASSSLLSASSITISEVSQVVKDTLQSARDCSTFLEGKVKKLDACIRHSDGAFSELWSIKSSFQENVNDTRLGIRLGTLSVSRSEGTGSGVSGNLTVASMRLQKQSLPEKFKPIFDQHMLPEHISIGLALRKDKPISHGTSKLFSYLPLPVTTSYPGHIHGLFILADDRRSIRLDHGSSDVSEASYNMHLLSLIPQLHLTFMENLGNSARLLEYWPDSAGQSRDIFAQVVADSLYTKLHLVDDRLVLETSAGQRISPAHAVLMEDTLSTGVKNILKYLTPASLVEVTMGHPLLSTEIRKVDQAYISKTIMDDRSKFIFAYLGKNITSVDIRDCVEFLLSDSNGIRLLDRLPLIPLEDGNLCEFRYCDSERPIKEYVISWHMSGQEPTGTGKTFSSMLDKIKARPVINPPLPPARFLHRELNLFFQEEVKHQSLNIRSWSNDVLIHFLEQRFEPKDTAELTSDEAEFVLLFWEYFCVLHSDLDIDERISCLPLVPAPRNGSTRHISLLKCQKDDVFIISSSDVVMLGASAEQILEELISFQAIIVKLRSLPIPLTRHLEPRFGLKEILGLFLSHNFDSYRISDENSGWNSLAKWIRSELEHVSSGDIFDSFLGTPRCIPIWPAFQVKRGARDHVLAASHSIKMIPRMIEMVNIIPYLKDGCFAAYDHFTLKLRLKAESITYTGLLSLLKFPDILAEGDLDIYKDLLLKRCDEAAQSPRPLVPNSSGVLRPCDALYSRSVPLFANILGPNDPGSLLHDVLTDDATRLSRFGLHHSLDLDSFKFCVGVLDDKANRTPDNALLLQHANSAYRCLSEDLIWNRDIGNRWNELDNFRFIPRSQPRCSYVLHENAETLMKPLRMIVTPNEVVNSSFEDVAWSQRARLARQPNERLLVEYKTFGVPTVNEVVEHLRVLRGIAGNDSALDERYLQDLQATYDFLDSRSDEAGDSLRQYVDDDLFLNVEELNDTPQWIAASRLIFNASDDIIFKEARGFLKPYEHLILKAGGQKFRSARPIEVTVSAPEEMLVAMRANFNEHRLNGDFIDVTFVDNSEPAGEHGAHRVILARLGDYFKSMFCSSGMKEARKSSTGVLENCVLLEHSGQAIQTSLEFFYTGSFDAERLDVQDLLDVLNLSNYWGVNDLKQATEKALVQHITHVTFKRISEHAEDARAAQLLESCREFEINNQDLLREFQRNTLEDD